MFPSSSPEGNASLSVGPCPQTGTDPVHLHQQGAIGQRSFTDKEPSASGPSPTRSHRSAGPCPQTGIIIVPKQGPVQFALHQQGAGGQRSFTNKEPAVSGPSPASPFAFLVYTVTVKSSSGSPLTSSTDLHPVGQCCWSVEIHLMTSQWRWPRLF